VALQLDEAANDLQSLKFPIQNDQSMVHMTATSHPKISSVSKPSSHNVLMANFQLNMG